MGAYAVIALAEDAKLLGETPDTGAGGHRLERGGRKPPEKLRRGKGLRGKLSVCRHA